MRYVNKFNGTCEICGKPVTAPRRKFCSQGCGRTAHNRRLREEHETQRCPIPLGSHDQRGIRTCLACNKEFASRGPENRICPPCTKLQHMGTAPGRPVRIPGSARRLFRGSDEWSE